jgi:Ras GTPase-activating-like protein IQGAP2/3
LTETTDIYDRKNMPRAVFCIHALSLKMYRNGSAPMIQDLYGRAQFTEAEISVMQVNSEMKSTR